MSRYLLLPSPAAQRSIPTYVPDKFYRALPRPPRTVKPQSISTEGRFEAHFERRPSADYCRDAILSLSSEGDTPDQDRRRSTLCAAMCDANSRIPPPPHAFVSSPRSFPSAGDLTSTGLTHVEMAMSYMEKPVNVDQGILAANRSSALLSPTHVMIHVLIFLVSTAILGTTVMLVYLLHLDELETPNPAALLAVVSSATSVASTSVVVHRLEKRVRNGQAAVLSRMTVMGVPLMFSTCAILAFIVFLVGIKSTTLEN